MVSRDVVENFECRAFPHRGIFLFVEPIAHTAAECRGYNRAVARVGLTGLGRPDRGSWGGAAAIL